MYACAGRGGRANFICILSGVYKLLSGSVRFLMHKHVNKRVRRSQNKYIAI